MNRTALLLLGPMAALLLLSGDRPGPPPAVPAAAPSPVVDEITGTPNLRQVANLPATGHVGTDLAFRGGYAYAGNYDGFTVYDISDPEAPEIAAQVRCPGPQNDVAVHGNLLFLGTDSPGSSVCADADGGEAGWEGIKIFDVTDPRRPRYVAAVATECGAHTLTLVPGKGTVHVWTTAPCADPEGRISIIEVPLDDPAAARVVATPELYATGPGETVVGCHDVTVYPEKGLAAAACAGDGLLLDMADPLAPRMIARVRDDNFAFWHSATFSNDATTLIFSDELGGGVGATCNPDTGPNRGANAVYEITAARELEFRSYFKIPREENGNCVAHNGSLIPVPGRDILVQAWFQGGVSVWDFTDPRRPSELAHWKRGPQPGVAGSWSAYWYNGYIYSSDMQKGLDVLRLDDPRTDPAKAMRTDQLNVQTQDGPGR